MKTALIAPIYELDNFEHVDKIHLLLSHLVSRSPYWQFYIKKKLAGDYIILDNSAHEFRKPVNPSKLIHDATFVRADEDVLPDVPYDSEGTIKATLECLDYWARDPEFRQLKPRLMLVPQAHAMKSCPTCLI